MYEIRATCNSLNRNAVAYIFFGESLLFIMRVECSREKGRVIWERFWEVLCKYRVTGYYRLSYRFVILKIVRGGRVTRVSRFDFRIGHGYFDSK